MDHFWAPFGSILGSRSAPGVPRRLPENPQELQSREKVSFKKPSKASSFSRFLRSRNLPREAREAREGSQEGPEALLVRHKYERKRVRFLTPFWFNFGLILGSFWGPFWRQNRPQNWTKNGTHFLSKNGTPSWAKTRPFGVL